MKKFRAADGQSSRRRRDSKDEDSTETAHKPDPAELNTYAHQVARRRAPVRALTSPPATGARRDGG